MTAVDWAVKNGARVLNLSFVGSRDPAIEQLLEAANQKGIAAVAAAGNGGPTAPPAYPAAYPGVIAAVTAVDEADRRQEHANRGSYIAVAAPGVWIFWRRSSAGARVSFGYIVRGGLRQRHDCASAGARSELGREGPC